MSPVARPACLRWYIKRVYGGTSSVSPVAHQACLRWYIRCVSCGTSGVFSVVHQACHLLGGCLQTSCTVLFQAKQSLKHPSAEGKFPCMHLGDVGLLRWNVLKVIVISNEQNVLTILCKKV